jgi:serine/threonine protein kinase
MAKSADARDCAGAAEIICNFVALGSISYHGSITLQSRLGAVFYFCVVGRPPFPEKTDAQKLTGISFDSPNRSGALQSEAPKRKRLAALIERMMAKNPALRPQTPQEVADALAPFTEHPIAPPPEDEMPRLCPAASRKQSPSM